MIPGGYSWICQIDEGPPEFAPEHRQRTTDDYEMDMEVFAAMHRFGDHGSHQLFRLCSEDPSPTGFRQVLWQVWNRRPISPPILFLTTPPATSGNCSESWALYFADESSLFWADSGELVLKGDPALLAKGREWIVKMGGSVSAPRAEASGKPASGMAPGLLAGPSSWTNQEGKTIRADFVRLEGDAVVVRRAGKDSSIPLSRLAQESVARARAFGEALKDVVLHYDFSDGGGAVVADRSGNGRHGRLVGFSNQAAGGGDTGVSGWQTEGNLMFDGVDDWVSPGISVADFTATGSFTIEAIVSHADEKRTWSPILSVEADRYEDPGVVQLLKADFRDSSAVPGSAIASRHNGLSVTGINSKSPTSLCDGRLHHVALVCDAGVLRDPHLFRSPAGWNHPRRLRPDRGQPEGHDRSPRMGYRKALDWPHVGTPHHEGGARPGLLPA